MSEDPAQKKRKVSVEDGKAINQGDDDDAVRRSKVKQQEPQRRQQEAEGGIHTVMIPPNNMNLSPIQKILFVDLQKENGGEVEVAMKQLDDFCSKGISANQQEQRTTIRAVGLFAIVNTIMRKWYANASIQKHGCGVLMSVYGSQDKTFRQGAKDSGAIDAVVWSLQNYPNDGTLQYYGLTALGVMIVLIPANTKYVAFRTKVHTAIIAAMQNFPDDSKIQRAAIIVLHEVLGYCSGATRKQIEAAGGLRALCDALDNHRNDESEVANVIQKYARAALKKLL